MMINKSPLIKLVLILSLILSACEKDDGVSGTMSSPLVGTYSFEGYEDIVVKKWVTNGEMVTPSNADKDSIMSFAISFNQSIFFTFTSDFKIMVSNSINNDRDTAIYKLSNNVVYVSIVDSPVNNNDYWPLFGYLNNKLYSYSSAFEFRSNSGSTGLNMLHLNPNLSILDSGLAYINYQSVNQLKVNEEIITCDFKMNYQKR